MPHHPTKRRHFIGQVAASAAVALTSGYGAPALAQHPTAAALPVPAAGSPWDLSWVDRLTGPYRAVFDTTEIEDGAAIGLASVFMDQFHEVYGSSDSQTQAVIVMRRKGIGMAFGDALWNDLAIGDDANISDPATHKPARRNPFYTAPASSYEASHGLTLQAIHTRGVILLACNIAAMHYAAQLAAKAHRDVEAVRTQVRGGLVPGAILVPSGIFALIRAQNAGCAYMRGA